MPDQEVLETSILEYLFVEGVPEQLIVEGDDAQVLEISSTEQLTVETLQTELIEVGIQGPPGATNYRCFDFTLSEEQIADAHIVLPDVPSTRVRLEFQNGIGQFQGIDFAVNANVIDWRGLAMELMASPGERVTVSYSA